MPKGKGEYMAGGSGPRGAETGGIPYGVDAGQHRTGVWGLVRQVREQAEASGRTVFEIVGGLEIAGALKSEILNRLFEDAIGIRSVGAEGSFIKKEDIIHIGFNNRAVRIVLKDGVPCVGPVGGFAFVFE